MPVDDISDSNIVKSISPMEAVVAAGVSRRKDEQRRNKEHSQRKEVRDYFHPLSKAVEKTNMRLLERKLPYKFKVFKRWGGAVYIELFTLNDDGSVRSKQRKDITHNDFNRIIDDVVSIEGLFFDQSA